MSENGIQPTERLANVPLLDSGEIVYVRPLPPFMRQLLVQESRLIHPDPKPEDFIRPLANAAREGATEPAALNPDYLAAKVKVQDERTNWLYNAVIKQDVVVDTPEGREATLARYAHRMAQLRKKVQTLPYEDEWQAVVLLCIVGGPADILRIGNAALDTLTEADIKAGIAFFRRHVQRNGAARDHREPGASRPKRRSQKTEGEL